MGLKATSCVNKAAPGGGGSTWLTLRVQDIRGPLALRALHVPVDKDLNQREERIQQVTAGLSDLRA